MAGGMIQAKALFVIRMATKDGTGPVQLLAHHNAHQRVRQGQRRQRPLLLAARLYLWSQPFRAADHQVDGACIQFPALQLAGQLFRTPALPLTSRVTIRSPGWVFASMASPSFWIRRLTSEFFLRATSGISTNSS